MCGSPGLAIHNSEESQRQPRPQIYAVLLQNRICRNLRFLVAMSAFYPIRVGSRSKRTLSDFFTVFQLRQQLYTLHLLVGRRVGNSQFRTSVALRLASLFHVSQILILSYLQNVTHSKYSMYQSRLCKKYFPYISCEIQFLYIIYFLKILSNISLCLFLIST